MISDWGKTYRDMIKYKGGYQNNFDSNGAFYAGILRMYWSQWKGWEIIDNYKVQGYVTDQQINLIASKDKKLKKFTEEFYKEEFWDKIHGDELPTVIANKLFDAAVDLKHEWSIVLLQRSLNATRMDKEQLFELLDEDGLYGRKTDTAIKAVFTEYGYNKGEDKIINWYCEYQKERYHAITTRNPKQSHSLNHRLKKASYQRG